MTREDVIRMAREAGIGPVYGYESIEHFFQAAYAAGAAAEREACAKVCEDDFGNGALNLADAIRARGQAWQEQWKEKWYE